MRYYVSTHSRPKAAGREFNKMQHWYKVSTHSRLKAAGYRGGGRPVERLGFNTQPPEGGCSRHYPSDL